MGKLARKDLPPAGAHVATPGPQDYGFPERIRAVADALRPHVKPMFECKDERLIAHPFEVDGVRWALPGEEATVEADGTIVVLGRSAQCINTGGEKVYVEEVESALKGHPDIADLVIVGVADEQWGQRVAAVVEPRAGHTPQLDDVRDHGRARLAPYKLPTRLVTVDHIVRQPSGKPDYRWAATAAEASD